MPCNQRLSRPQNSALDVGSRVLPSRCACSIQHLRASSIAQEYCSHTRLERLAVDGCWVARPLCSGSSRVAALLLVGACVKTPTERSYDSSCWDGARAQVVRTTRLLGRRPCSSDSSHTVVGSAPVSDCWAGAHADTRWIDSTTMSAREVEERCTRASGPHIACLV